METLESVFMGLPNACILKTPNCMQLKYTCVYKQQTKNSILTIGDTPSEAVIRMAEALALKGIA